MRVGARDSSAAAHPGTNVETARTSHPRLCEKRTRPAFIPLSARSDSKAWQLGAVLTMMSASIIQASALVANPTHDTPEALSSMQLVVRAKGGDERARNEICRRYLPRLRRWAHGRLPKNIDGVLSTEDIVQETLLKVMNGLPHFEPSHEGSFQAYLSQALRNRIFDERRKAGRRPIADELDAAQPSTAPSPLEETIGRDNLERYEAALDRLGPLDRAAVSMRLEWGFSYAEIARDLNLPTPGAATMRVRRALVRLAEDMSHGRRTD